HRLQGRLGARHREGFELLEAESLLEQGGHGMIVFDDQDAPHAGAPFGRRISNRLPSPRRLSTLTKPPCSTTMSFVMLRPRPVPSAEGFVVKNGSQILSSRSPGRPAP